MTIQERKSKELEIFLMNDQPFTCPSCGARCIELASFAHTNAKALMQECRNSNCAFRCMEQQDEYYLKLWYII